MKPLVSVIVPNYNHRPYLAERLRSIEAQSYPEMEYILLDDASTDGSAELLAQWAEERPRARFIPNEKNSGSPFIQWNRGAKEAQGRYLWIAESDDFCEPQMVARLVEVLEAHPDAGIAYAQSMLVDERSRKLHSYEENLRFIYQSEAWQSDFCVDGREACRKWLFFHNPIPNASGLLLRRESFLEAGQADPQMRLNGDWYLYVKILLRSRLCFVAQPLNYFRTHEQSQRSASRKNASVYQELLQIHETIRKALPEAQEEAQRSKQEFGNWWIGNLPYHALTRENWQLNRKLYREFAPVRSPLAWRIFLTFLISYTRDLLGAMRLLKPLKLWRSRLFPGKYWPP